MVFSVARLFSLHNQGVDLHIAEPWLSGHLRTGHDMATTWPRLSRSLVAAVASDDALHPQPLSATVSHCQLGKLGKLWKTRSRRMVWTALSVHIVLLPRYLKALQFERCPPHWCLSRAKDKFLWVTKKLIQIYTVTLINCPTAGLSNSFNDEKRGHRRGIQNPQEINKGRQQRYRKMQAL